jgi:hypothetical protein
MYAAHCRDGMLRLGRGVGGDGRQPSMDAMQSQAARDCGLIDGALADAQRLYCPVAYGVVGRYVVARWCGGPPVLASLIRLSAAQLPRKDPQQLLFCHT